MQAGQRFILALDDYHRISSRDVHQLIDALLLHPPRPLHLALGTRYDPPLSLTTLRARWPIWLRFGVARCASRTTKWPTFLRQTLHFPPEQQTVAKVAERTEGWVAGLRFAALALNAKGDDQLIPEVSADNRFAMEYLLSEVLARLPTSTQAFLMQTAVLDRLSGPLCDALTGEVQGGNAWPAPPGMAGTREYLYGCAR